MKDRDGKAHTLRIGYIGFVPPQILVWDKANLQGKVTVDDITATAKRYVPQMRKQGADLVVASPHSGLSSEPYKAMAENSVYYLSQVPGIDLSCSVTPMRCSRAKTSPTSKARISTKAC